MKFLRGYGKRALETCFSQLLILLAVSFPFLPLLSDMLLQIDIHKFLVMLGETDVSCNPTTGCTFVYLCLGFYTEF